MQLRSSLSGGCFSLVWGGCVSKWFGWDVYFLLVGWDGRGREKEWRGREWEVCVGGRGKKERGEGEKKGGGGVEEGK